MAAGTPIVLARVTLLDADGQPVTFMFTDAQGQFLLVAPEPGQYWIKAQSAFHEDYSDGPISLAGADTVSLVFGLKPLPVELPELVIEAERLSPRLALEGVYDRREARIGQHFDQRRLRARPGYRVSDLVALLPSVELWPDSAFGGVRVLFRRRQFERLITRDGERPPPCFPQVFMNGVVLARGGNTPGYLNRISVSDLEAVEVYESPAFLPGRFYGTFAHCGTIVLWTR